ncbi:MAG: YkgJ family cysteine cluster protein [Planctomycetota bacterium]|jgi:Fe-S-cluster containining protein
MAVTTDPRPRTKRKRPAPREVSLNGKAKPRSAKRSRRAKPEPPFAETKCGGCIALCCRYFAIEVDAPTEPKDFDDLKWYILHDKVELFTEGRSWYVQVFNKCTNLGLNNECLDYENRPGICREYENDFCDRDEVDGKAEPDNDLTFRTVPELEAYKVKWVKRWEAKRRKARRASALKAAATRKRNAARRARKTR